MILQECVRLHLHRPIMMVKIFSYFCLITERGYAPTKQIGVFTMEPHNWIQFCNGFEIVFNLKWVLVL